VIPQTATTTERLKNLQQCTSLLQLTMPAVIDSDDNVVNRAYAAWPDRLYVVDREGRIAFKGEPGPSGFRPAEVEAWLEKNVDSVPGS
jgi:type I thyroxine 5'-deiodinase